MQNIPNPNKIAFSISNLVLNKTRNTPIVARNSTAKME